MYDLAIFDLDGTLIDSVGDIADALNRVLATDFSDTQVAGWVGAGVHQLLRGALAPVDEGRHRDFLPRVLEGGPARPVRQGNVLVTLTRKHLTNVSSESGETLIDIGVVDDYDLTIRLCH